MAKFFLGIAIVAFTSFCGFLLARKYRQRKQFFTQLRDFNERFLTEINYYRRPLKEFASKYVYKGEFRLLLQEYFRGIDESFRALRVLESSDFSFLKKDEKSFVADYLQSLGKADSSSQKAYFSSVKDTLGKLYTEATENCKKYGDLYIKLGFLCGLLILILII